MKRKLPEPCPKDAAGGWVIELLPFLEETALADRFSNNPPLAQAGAWELARLRPAVLTCPSAYEEDSSIAHVPPSHYTAVLVRGPKVDRLRWEVGELPTDSRVPWITSPELPYGGPQALAPHSGGYQTMTGYGARFGGVGFVMGN